MARPLRRFPVPTRQRGWAFVVVLVALAIVAFLGRDALSRYFGTVRNAAESASTHVPPAAVLSDPAMATPLSTTPVERARAVEDLVKDQAADRARGIDGQTR